MPTDEAAADALIARSTIVDPVPVPSRSVPHLIQRIEAGPIVMGMASIAERLQNDQRTLVFGTHHDSGAQVRTFRRLLTASSRRVIGLEMLRASGRWRGVDEASQAGDNALVRRYLERGEGLRAFLASQEDHNYTAWKYDYLDEVADLLIQARAEGHEVIPCDMPGALQNRLRSLSEESRLRLRELHCVHALGGRLPGAALLWGEAHLEGSGLRRFVEAPGVHAIHMVGGRKGTAGIEAALGERLRVSDAVLVPLGANDSALIIPDRHTRWPVHRARIREPEAALEVRVRFDDGDVTVRNLASTEQRAVQSGEPLQLGAGRWAIFYRIDDRLHLAQVLTGRGALDVDVSGPEVSTVDHTRE